MICGNASPRMRGHALPAAATDRGAEAPSPIDFRMSNPPRLLIWARGEPARKADVVPCMHIARHVLVQTGGVRVQFRTSKLVPRAATPQAEMSRAAAIRPVR